MKIEKDAEWLRLEGRVGQLQGDLREAERRLVSHVSAETLRQFGLEVGSMVVYKGSKYSVTRADDYWIYGGKVKKDGSPSKVEWTIFDGWTKADPQ